MPKVELELTEEQLDDFIQWLHDTSWIYDDNSGRSEPSVYCGSCQTSGSNKNLSELHHKPDCVVRLVLEQAQKAVRRRCTATTTTSLGVHRCDLEPGHQHNHEVVVGHGSSIYW